MIIPSEESCVECRCRQQPEEFAGVASKSLKQCNFCLSVVVHAHCMLHRQNGYICRHGGDSNIWYFLQSWMSNFPFLCGIIISMKLLFYHWGLKSRVVVTSMFLWGLPVGVGCAGLIEGDAYTTILFSQPTAHPSRSTMQRRCNSVTEFGQFKSEFCRKGFELKAAGPDIANMLIGTRCPNSSLFHSFNVKAIKIALQFKVL